MSIADFILARLAEDEATAREASVGRVWTWAEGNEQLYSDHARTYGLECIIDTEGANPPGPDAGAHIARHDPARVLRQVEVMRRVVELHQSWPVLVQRQPTFEQAEDIRGMALRASQQIAWFTEQEYTAKFGDEPPTAPILRALAGIWSDHADYDPAWGI